MNLRWKFELINRAAYDRYTVSFSIAFSKLVSYYDISTDIRAN